MAGTDLQRQNHKINLLITVGVIVVLVCAATVGIVLWHSRATSKGSTSDDAQKQSQRIIDQVGKLYVVPAGETPTVAQIKDKSKLTDNKQFYDKAQNGDYVLVYQQAMVALLYRETENKLVYASPVASPEAAPAAQSKQ